MGPWGLWSQAFELLFVKKTGQVTAPTPYLWCFLSPMHSQRSLKPWLDQENAATEFDAVGEIILNSFCLTYIVLFFLFPPPSFKSEMPRTAMKCPLSSGFLKTQKYPCRLSHIHRFWPQPLLGHWCALTWENSLVTKLTCWFDGIRYIFKKCHFIKMRFTSCQKYISCPFLKIIHWHLFIY